DPDSVRSSIEQSQVCEEHVAHVDPAEPGLIAHVWCQAGDDAEIHGHILIDGNHRAARSLRENRPFFAYVLSEEESRAILLPNPESSGGSDFAEHDPSILSQG